MDLHLSLYNLTNGVLERHVLELINDSSSNLNRGVPLFAALEAAEALVKKSSEITFSVETAKEEDIDFSKKTDKGISLSHDIISPRWKYKRPDTASREGPVSSL